jgi:hypothetical protein
MTIFTRRFHGLLDTQYATISSWQTTKREIVPHHIVTHSRRLLYEFRMHLHPYPERLVSELVEKDIEGLEALDTAVPELREEFFADRYKPKLAIAPRGAADLGDDPAAVVARVVDADGKTLRDLLPVKDLDFDYSQGAYAVYNWEIFFHVPFTIALQLSKNQRFAEAQRWFHCIFDPTDNSDGPAPQRFWKVKPFRINEVEHIENTLLNLATGDDQDLQDRTISAISAWRDKPFRPHLVARTRPTAYMYATVMAYLDNLVAWGDSLFRQDTRESINEAMQYYVLAANILGPQPEAIPRKGSLAKQTYASLRNDVDEFGNAARDLEADIPFDLAGPPRPVDGGPEDAPLESLGRSLYFCVPRNDKLLGYWSLVGDRLFKMRNSLNLQGVFRQLPLFAPPIDPAMLARAIAAGVDVASIIAGTAAPLAPVRFQILLQKALEICQEVKSLGGQILSALEKKDNEALSVLRARHESNLLSLAESVRYAQWQEAIKNREGVQRGIENAFQRYRYYERLLGRDDGALAPPDWTALEATTMDNREAPPEETLLESRSIDVDISGNSPNKLMTSSHEVEELSLQSSAQGSQRIAADLESTAAFLNIIPIFAADIKPVGVGAGLSLGGRMFAQLLSGIASVYRAEAGEATYSAGLASKIGTYSRRQQEWSFQSNSAAGEINQLLKQLRSAEIREYIAKREYDNHQKQIAQARDVEDFLTNEKRKTTTENFYLWMKREAQGLHAQYFQFALDVAKKAERALQHELGVPDRSFIQMGYLSGREGLFAGEKLYLDVKRMDMAYLELNGREFEITKHISIRDWFPLQLLDLRATGRCEVDIPEALFDLDCPGHMLRRIKSVAVTIPCVTGPYASANCSLMLLQSQVRTKGTTLDGPQGPSWYPTDPAEPDTERFVSYPVAKDSIVTSGAPNDTGMFEPNLRDERYLPFEGAGVISRWAIELLGNPRQFDYDTIADLILTFRYTARPGAPQAMVSTAVRSWLKNNSARLLSMRHEFPSEWARFLRTQVAPGQTASLAFVLKDDHFPYQMQGGFENARRVHLFGRTKTSQVAVELKRGTTSVGTTTLAEGQGILEPPAQGGTAGSFDPRGSFELRFDTTAFNDLWIVVDWSTN